MNQTSQLQIRWQLFIIFYNSLFYFSSEINYHEQVNLSQLILNQFHLLDSVQDGQVG